MKKVIVFILFCIFLLGSILFTHPFTHLQAAGDGLVDPPTFTLPIKGLITNRDMENGRISTTNQAILGPNSCIDYGDPYSPLNSIYAPGPYTYTYLIHIPADYNYDIVRIELLDPDSINTSDYMASVFRTNIAINNGLETVESKTCGVNGGSIDQTNPCALNTDELTLVTGAPNLDFDQINPLWFVRIDENRGTGSPPGNGTCGSPPTYDPKYNTQTLFSLYYFAQNSDNTISQVPLVAYMGQTGDGVRDTGNHLTDLRWVSPGADIPFSAIDDPGTAVPAIAQTIDSFEVDLTTDVPGIVTESSTGDRYLYLDVQTLSGASENGFDLWAGPPNYVNTIPSHVNMRNLAILNNPGAHYSVGVEILALGILPQNSNAGYPVDIPLLTVGTESIGQTITVSMFDSDSGAQPPIIFYFDSHGFTPDGANPLGYDPDQTDWAWSFAVAGQDDPDGVAEGVRCAPGSCQSQWVNPAYQITVPGSLDDCDWTNPTMNECTPFYGGRLMARYDGGSSDTYTWQISVPQEPSDDLGNPTVGCAAFPIGINEAARSVTAPGTGSNPYPDAVDFNYPSSPPLYDSFLDHQDDMPLLNATPGDVFRMQNGFGNGSFGWLVWNTGIVPNAATLVNSLTSPGDTLDYTDHPDGGTAVPGSGFAHVVRGYIEPTDPTDQALHIGDWIAASTGSINSSSIRAAVNEHIDLGRTLRLPVWNNSSGNQYQTTQFAIFRLIGYNIPEEWLLLEFVGFDTSCGQLAAAPTAVSLTGPTTGAPNTSYNFTADVSPSFTTTPITYTWEISNQETITNTGGVSNTVSLIWESVGSKEVVLTAVNSTGLSVNQSHIIDIASPDKIHLPLILNNPPN